MASLAYMQVRHEEGRDPKRAALYTGLAYIIVVILLVLPFFLTQSVTVALIGMLVTILLLIAGFSFYASVLFDRDFTQQMGEMFLFSLGVSGISFLVGLGIRHFISH